MGCLNPTAKGTLNCRILHLDSPWELKQNPLLNLGEPRTPSLAGTNQNN